MRIALLLGDAPNQAALAVKLSRRQEVAGIVLSRNQVPAAGRRASQTIASRTVGRPFTRAWQRVLDRYRVDYQGLPDVPVVQVEEVNASATLSALRRFDADVHVVSGTTLVKAPIIDFAKGGRGMLNLHTGLSPYVKGGPNCTNWCLAEGWFGLIGNTVMWIELGVDSGNIAASQLTPLDGGESLEELHWDVMEHAHELLGRVVAQVAAGKPVPSVPQDTISSGRTFRNAEWNARAMMRARRNLHRIRRGAGAQRAADRREIKTVEL